MIVVGGIAEDGANSRCTPSFTIGPNRLDALANLRPGEIRCGRILCHAECSAHGWLIEVIGRREIGGDPGHPVNVEDAVLHSAAGRRKRGADERESAGNIVPYRVEFEPKMAAQGAVD